MFVKLLFFGPTRDAVGESELQIPVDPNATAIEVFNAIPSKFPGLRSRTLLFAINQEYATGDEVLCDGDEIAIFTPVSGG